MRPCTLPSLLQETLVAPHRFLLDATQLLVARIWARKSFTSVAQDIRVLDFVGKRGLNHPSKTKDLVQPNGNIIVDTIYRTAEHGDSYRY
ncbi:hypothetical protein FRC0360_02167 [Corynebacterium diphtheriae]|nr:hypothetical protein FRC0360_02167 [Corynebacterium diphtheriae]